MEFKIYENWSDGSYGGLVTRILEDKWRLLRKVDSVESKQILFDDFDKTLSNINIEHLGKMQALLIESIDKCLEDDGFRNKIYTEPENTHYFDEFESCLRYGGSVPLTEYSFLKEWLSSKLNE